MAKYREYSYEQEMLLPVSLGQQIQPGTFEYTLNYVVDQEIDLKVFERRYSVEGDPVGLLAGGH